MQYGSELVNSGFFNLPVQLHDWKTNLENHRALGPAQNYKVAAESKQLSLNDISPICFGNNTTEERITAREPELGQTFAINCLGPNIANSVISGETNFSPIEDAQVKQYSRT